MTNQQQERLCKAVEDTLRQAIQTPKNFQFLREQIYARLHLLISTSTLKRVWGYLQSDVEPSQSTLDTLARFVGYADYQHFCQYDSVKGEESSNLILGRHIDVKESLDIDDRLTLYWLPNRICDLRYMGNMKFVVTESENTRLQKGDTFCCHLLIEGEPLYLSQLSQGSNAPVNYVCGKQGGIRFEMKKSDVL
ncbi:MAG: hypothetical protein IJ580_07260 [Prevotella sp.]|nr:hypothetical protein [Prevotella sp.]